jgi:uncharacterized membrane protein YbhN (UPF0104 family)
MQYRYSLSLKKETRAWLGFFIRLGVFISVVVYLYLHFSDQQTSWNQVLTVNNLTHPALWLTFLLVPLNWGIESAKWKFIVSLHQPLSWNQAVKGVLSGLAFGLVTPRAVGDYAGRMMALNTHDSARFIGSLMLSRLAQLMVTLIFGSLGVYVLFGEWLALLVLFCGPLMFLTAWYLSGVWQFPGKKYVQPYLDGLNDLSTRDLGIISLYSVLRYVIFTIQFTLVMMALTTVPVFVIVAGVSWIFLAKSVLPGFNFLADLGIREFSAVFFFSALGHDTLPVVMASLLIWLINIAIPSLTGAVILLRQRWS